MQIAEQERIASPTFVLAWVVSFLQFLAFYALVTTMAVYAVRQFAASDAGAGLASSAFVIGATLSRVVTGHVVDRFGKRRVLVVALVAVSGDFPGSPITFRYDAAVTDAGITALAIEPAT